jgi:hypothetical protein
MKSIMKNAVDKVSCAAATLGNSVTRNVLATINHAADLIRLWRKHQ